jgi:transposase
LGSFQSFTREFKLEAVQLARTSGKSLTQVARDLGIADSTLHHWCKLFSEQGSQAFPGSGRQTPQEEEVRRLKRELEVTRQERDILKKPHVEFLPTEELIINILKQPLEPSLKQQAESK